MSETVVRINAMMAEYRAEIIALSDRSVQLAADLAVANTRIKSLVEENEKLRAAQAAS